MTVKEKVAAAEAALEMERLATKLDDAVPPSEFLTKHSSARLAEYVAGLYEMAREAQRVAERTRAGLLNQGVAAPGLPVSVTAHLLGISEPTVRAWIKQGSLKVVRGEKPLLVDLASVAKAQRAVELLRERGEVDEDWANSLYDAIEAKDALESDQVRRSLQQIREGKFRAA